MLVGVPPQLQLFDTHTCPDNCKLGRSRTKIPKIMKDIRITHRARTLFLALSIAMMLIGAVRAHAVSIPGVHPDSIPGVHPVSIPGIHPVSTWTLTTTQCRAYDHDRRAWLPWADGTNDYAGRFGHSIDGIELSCEYEMLYRVHYKGGSWLPWVYSSENDFAGIYGKPIDAIEIDTLALESLYMHVSYQVHLKGSGWLPPVTGANINDSGNGYAGIYGREIDGFCWSCWYEIVD